MNAKEHAAQIVKDSSVELPHRNVEELGGTFNTLWAIIDGGEMVRQHVAENKLSRQMQRAIEKALTTAIRDYVRS